ncbi:hypothetical protein KBJ98_07755 [Flavobacterium sp. F-328]|uniref:Lipoprotein n=1 Tax=Flavobacterium erciyesense TaxID=2825842 RepID=A0ABS5D3I8_9FLAO|nr:hypothetical protein [Flavobacterium erciyesense]MBQ0908592.1 hypothetical protein [Flavobacterium erciyesense]
MKNLYQFIIVISMFYGCNSSPNIKPNETNINRKSTEKITEKEKITPKIKIDSVKMHAFDNIYFGFQNDPIKSKYMINGMEYYISMSTSLPSKGLQSFTLQNKKVFKTEKNAKQVLSDLQKTISTKYKNTTVLNKTFYIEEELKRTNDFEKNFLNKYDENRIGEPYEFISCIWNLKYKIIQIGYLISYPNMMTTTESTPSYSIYIEFESKIITMKKQNEPNYKKNDSSKF